MQQSVPDHVRVVATGVALDTLGYVVVVTLAPILTDVVPARVVLLLGGLIVVLASPAAMLLYRRASPHSASACTSACTLACTSAGPSSTR